MKNLSALISQQSRLREMISLELPRSKNVVVFRGEDGVTAVGRIVQAMSSGEYPLDPHGGESFISKGGAEKMLYLVPNPAHDFYGDNRQAWLEEFYKGKTGDEDFFDMAYDKTGEFVRIRSFYTAITQGVC